MDFRAPSIKDICNFMCFLFKKNRCPSTIEGYRTVIADTLGNVPLDSCNNAEIVRLVASLNRDIPQSTRKIPNLNLSLVLHQLNQPPFERLEEASLKYTTWKTVFLLALASGKKRVKKGGTGLHDNTSSRWVRSEPRPHRAGLPATQGNFLLLKSLFTC